jgi:hypothetical protein
VYCDGCDREIVDFRAAQILSDGDRHANGLLDTYVDTLEVCGPSCFVEATRDNTQVAKWNRVSLATFVDSLFHSLHGNRFSQRAVPAESASSARHRVAATSRQRSLRSLTGNGRSGWELWPGIYRDKCSDVSVSRRLF